MPALISWFALVIVVAGLAAPRPAYSQSEYSRGGGTLSVLGDVALPEGDVEWVSMVAHSPENPMEPKPQDPCHVDFGLRTGDATIRLTAILNGGLPATFWLISKSRPFDVGQAEPFGIPWQDERQHPGTFFATLGLGPSEERKIDVRTIPGSGTFRSNGKGRLNISHFDGSVVLLTFRVPMIENIGKRFNPRHVTIVGSLFLRFALGPFGEAFQIGSHAPNLFVLDNVASYRCGNLDEVRQAAVAAAAATSK